MKQLHWGQTPWDDLAPNQLRTRARLMYEAIKTLERCLLGMRHIDRYLHGQEDPLYWGMDGSGGIALEKARQCGTAKWERLSQKKLLRAVQRMYSAMIALESCLDIMSILDPSEYWTPRQEGGQALELAKRITEPLHQAYGSDQIYRMFFRYADDLLFDQTTGYSIGCQWAVCPICNQMLGTGRSGTTRAGSPCAEVFSQLGCPGVFRPLVWDDLKPTPSAKADVKAT